MQILWMKSDYVVPPDTGGKIRTYNLLRELHMRCPITYTSFRANRSVDKLPPMDECAQTVVTFYRAEENKSGPWFYWRIIRGMRSHLPYIVQKYRSAAFREAQSQWFDRIQREGSKDDSLVVCDFLEMSENVDWSIPVPKVLFQHNIESMIWRRYSENELNPAKRAYFEFEYKRMKAYESAVCNKYDLIFTVSHKDRDALRHDLGVGVPVEVLETGVDTVYFTPDAARQPVPGRMLFLGSMDWMPNIDGAKWFVSSIYPLIRELVPHATLQIVGRRPADAIRRLATEDPSIQVIQDVADVRPYVASADLFIVPLRIGGGSRIKIYEAMAMGRPVVATSIGAEGLPLKRGEHLAVCDSPGEFARRVEFLTRNVDEKNRMAARGFDFVVNNCPWSRIATALYERCRIVARSDRLVAPA